MPDEEKVAPPPPNATPNGDDQETDDTEPDTEQTETDEPAPVVQPGSVNPNSPEAGRVSDRLEQPGDRLTGAADEVADLK